MEKLTPRLKAKKSLMWTAPITMANSPRMTWAGRSSPMSRKTFSQAAMNAKYASPLISTNEPATARIFQRSFRFTSIESRNSSTHIAQGLKPSTSPTATVNSGKPSESALRRPKNGSSISLAESSLIGASPASGTGREATVPSGPAGGKGGRPLVGSGGNGGTFSSSVGSST